MPVFPSCSRHVGGCIQAADQSGLFNEKFVLMAEQAKEREDKDCTEATRSVLKPLYDSTSPLVDQVLTTLESTGVWHQVAAAAKLELLQNSLRDAVPLVAEKTGQWIARELSVMVLNTALVVAQYSVYPSTLEEVPRFEQDMQMLLELVRRWSHLEPVEASFSPISRANSTV